MKELDKEILEQLEKLGTDLFRNRQEGEGFAQTIAYRDKAIEIYVAFDKTDNVDFAEESPVEHDEVEKMHNRLKVNKLKEINEFVIYYYIVRLNAE